MWRATGHPSVKIPPRALVPFPPPRQTLARIRRDVSRWVELAPFPFASVNSGMGLFVRRWNCLGLPYVRVAPTRLDVLSAES